ncbi:MAG: S-layer domain protein [Clostridia bacterium]|jgi:hypothetical protein|nr:S-layer domain protein [Clostridia bacterium]
MKKRLLSLLLVVVMGIGMMPVTAFGAKGDAPAFSDMQNDWSATALENAVKNGLLAGNSDKIMPKDNLTRAQMAVIVNRAFGTTEKAALGSYTDVAASAWYYEDMAKAVQMKTFTGYGGKLNPSKSITREEAFVVLANAFKLSGATASTLDNFSDKGLVSTWAKDGVASLVSAGYITGSNGQINPKKNITRAEFAQLMDNILKNYIKAAGTYTSDLNGNVMINVPNVTLKNMTITGDLIIGDGVGDGDVTLDGVVVTGRTVIRGGGVNSIKVIGSSNLQNIIIARVEGQVRVYAEDGTQIGEVIVDGSDNVTIEGNVGTVTIAASDITVTATQADIVKTIIEGDRSMIIVSEKSTIKTVAIEGENAKIITLTDSKIDDIIVSGDGAAISGTGTIKTVEANANDTTVTTIGTKVIAETNATGVSAGTVPVAPGKTEIVGGVPVVTPTHSGGGGSGGSSSVAVSAINSTGITTATGTAIITLGQVIPSLAAGDIVVKKDGTALTNVTNYTLSSLSGTSVGITFDASAGLISTSVVTVEIVKAGYTINSGSPVAIVNSISGTITVTASSNGIAIATGTTTITLGQAITGLAAGDIVVKKDGVALTNVTNYALSGLSGTSVGITFDASADLISTSVVTVEIVKAGYTIGNGNPIPVTNTIPPTVASVNAVFTADAIVASGTTVALTVPAGMTAWFAPTGKTLAGLSAGASMTTAIGGATSIQAPTDGGTYKFYLVNAANSLIEGINTLTVTTAIEKFNIVGTEITGYDITGGTNVVIPETIVATNIGARAFQSKSITSITIPNTVTNIGVNAFADCPKLTNVTIANDLTTISDGAFASCPNLTNITIPKGLTTINKNTFANCTGLKSISLPDGLTTISYGAFNGCSSLRTSLPNTVTTIGDYAFANCSSLKDEDIPMLNVQSIGVGAFVNDTQLKTLNLPKVTSIDSMAFCGNDITSITIGAGATINNNLLNLFDNNFRDAYTTGGAGTYTGTQTTAWTKQ